MDLANERQFALDIEATIRDGALDVGIFAPEEMLVLGEADSLVGRMKEALGGLGKVEQ